MTRRKGRRERPPLDQERLDELALTYVGRFATTRAKLASYLDRKVRERGWSAEAPPDIEAAVQRLARLGYVDDAAYALSKSRALSARGLGERRLGEALRAAGVSDEDSADARALAGSEAAQSALRFARRRRLGPFAVSAADRAAREKALAAMVRAGHGFDLSRAIIALEPGAEIDLDSLAERL